MHPLQVLVASIGALVLIFHLAGEIDRAREQGYKAGFDAGVASVKSKECTPQQAAAWWIGTTNMREAKRELCGAKR